MNRLATLLLVLTFNCYSQSKFEKGYFINNKDQNINCLIKIDNWTSNPNTISYKHAKNSEIKTAVIEDIKEIRVANFKYKKFKIKSNSNKVEYQLLRYLIEGHINLYLHKENNSETYYYNVRNYEITKLENEKTKSPQKNFRQHILSFLRCNDIPAKDIETLNYEYSDLIHYFINYNDCIRSKYTVYDNQFQKGSYNFKIKVGGNMNSLSIPPIEVENSISEEVSFGNTFGINIGIETEFILPIQKSKWSIFIDPSLNFLKGPNSNLDISGEQVTFNYNTIELPYGIRRYFILDHNSKLFISGSFTHVFNMNSMVVFKNSPDIEFSKSNHVSLAIGANLKNRYSFEIKYHLINDNLFKESYYESDFNKISFNFAYTLFQE